MARRPSDSGGQSQIFRKRATRVLQALLAVSLCAAVWVIGFSPGNEPAPLLPDTETQFSLDLDVVNTADHDIVYAVEQRARPFYRIFSLDPRTGDVDTVFTVPESAIIYGIALNPTGDTLAVAYSPDFGLEGSGIWTLDLETNELSEVVPVDSGLYLTDITWSPDGDSVLATHVDRRGPDEVLSIARVSLAAGSVEVLAGDAINPIEVDDTVYYLTVDENSARRSIGLIDNAGSTDTVAVGDSSHDLDHLLAGEEDATVRVAILETVDGGITFGEPASAHGNHDVASTWWSVATDAAIDPVSTGLEGIIVYDAVSDGDTIVYATNEGLAIGSTTRLDLIESRAISFVAS